MTIENNYRNEPRRSKGYEDNGDRGYSGNQPINRRSRASKSDNPPPNRSYDRNYGSNNFDRDDWDDDDEWF